MNIPRTKAVSIVWGLAPGGITNYVKTIDDIQLVADVDLQHIVISSPNWAEDKLLCKKINPIEVKIKGRFDLSWKKKIYRQIDDINPDILMVHAVNGYYVARQCLKNCNNKFKIVGTFHGQYHPPNISRLPFVALFNHYSERFLSKWADKVITLSTAGKNYLIKKGVPGKKIIIINNGIPDVSSSESVRQKIRREWGINKLEIVIGATSRLDPIKGLQDLIKAFEYLNTSESNMRLLLVGDGPQKDSLINLSKRSGIKRSVTFLGYRENVSECLNAFDVFILPSISEAHSIGLLEAMRASLPIVCTDIEGNLESVVPGHEATVFKPGDVNGMAKGIQKLVSNKKMAKNMGRNARKRYERDFTDKKMLSRIARVIQETKNEIESN